MIDVDLAKQLTKGKPYKYKELCIHFGEEVKTGKAKILQLENWRRFFEWENPTTQQYVVTAVYDAPKEKSPASNTKRGGARKNAGRKRFAEEEVEYLTLCMLDYYRKLNDSSIIPIQITNSEIDIYFGLRREEFYAAKNSQFVDQELLKTVSEKLREKRTLIVKRLKADNRFKAVKGLIGFLDRKNHSTVAISKELPTFEKYQKEYLEKQGKKLYEVVDEGKWREMIDYISKQEEFKKYESVCPCLEIQDYSDALSDFKYDLDELGKHKRRLNELVVDSIKSYFVKNKKGKYSPKDIGAARYILNQYVRLPL